MRQMASPATVTEEYPEEERITILFGSHGGTAEETADALCQEIAEKKKLPSHVAVVGPMALDNFVKDPQWTRIVIIVVSSFGMGHAPRNARQFRKLCDHWSTQLKDNAENKPLAGIHFALLGLGSSRYSTYQENPNAVYQGMTAAGARLIGDKGVADSAEGREPQQAQITEWTEALWQPLTEAITNTETSEKPLSDAVLQEMNAHTVLP
mmetsp:Transcript_13527/g.25799  ORF Transcript_13527/g.25799 Transcript_13527/m.25799 type:complete len:209 (+) Transcript_13527:91-717(+)